MRSNSMVEWRNHNPNVAGSNPVFAKFLGYSVAVARLFWEQKVMCSNHIIPKEVIKR